MSVGQYESKVYDATNFGLCEQIEGTGLRILDIGCGSGSTVMFLVSKGHTVSGVTLSKAEACIARELGLDVYEADCTGDLPFNENSFDIIYMSHVLEHLPFPTDALCSLRRYLKPSGKFLIAVPNIAHWRPRIQLAMGRFPQHDYGIFDRTHLRFLTFRSSKEIVERADLAVEVHRVTGNVPLPIVRKVVGKIAVSIDRLGLFLAPNLFGSEIIIVAKIGLKS